MEYRGLLKDILRSSAARVASSLILVCLLGSHGGHHTAFAGDEGLETVRKFLAEVNRHQYRKAYTFLSKALKEELLYPDFKTGLEKVKRVQLLAYDPGSSYATGKKQAIQEATVRVKALEWDRGKVIPRIYKGKVVMIRERGGWRFIQAELLSKPPEKHPSTVRRPKGKIVEPPKEKNREGKEGVIWRHGIWSVK